MALFRRNRILRWVPFLRHTSTPGAPRTIAIGACLAAFAGLCAWIGLPLYPWVAEFSFDLPMVLSHSSRPEEALVVLMDEESYRERGQDTKRGWDRSLHAELLDTVFARGAKAVVFDVIFDGPSQDPAVDSALARAMSIQNRKVILAAKLAHSRVDDQAEMVTLIEPIEPFLSATSHGIVDLPSSADLALRRHGNNRDFPSLAAMTVQALGRSVEEPTREQWIKYYGDARALRSISYNQALRPADLAPDVFSNRVVFVGQGKVTTAEGSNTTDLYRTPYTRWSKNESPGVEVQATVFLNLWRREWLERLASPFEAGVLALTGILIGAGLSWLRPKFSVFVAIVIALAAIVGSALAISGAHRWFPWLLIVGVQVPCGLAWSFATHLRRTAEVAPSVKIPDHTLIRRVGRGGYGEVWLAQDVIGNYHAIKLVYRTDFTDGAPFDRELRGIEKFTPISRSHPGFVHILHVGKPESGDYFFYIMEAADDTTSGQRIDPQTYTPRTLGRYISRRGRIPLGECIDLGIDLATALEQLHQHQLIHRDIKPSNIIFVNNVPKFADIGLVTDVAARTSDVSKVGTEGYLAPEGPGTPAADVFSLGMVLYESSMGLEPQQFPELTTALRADAAYDRLRELHNIILTACETDPVHRYRSASELCAALMELRDCIKAAGGV